MKQIDREAAWQLKLPSSMVLDRFPGDSVTHKVSLEGFVVDQARTDDQQKWEAFLERSRLRTAKEMDKKKTMYEKVFGS